MKKILFCLAVFFFMSTNADAALIELDRYNPGDGLITLDPLTGLEWLDLTETQNMSYNNIISDLAIQSEGWRHATGVEVGNLLITYIDIPGGFSGSSSGTGTTISATATNIDETQSFFGITYQYQRSMPPYENVYEATGFFSDNGSVIDGDFIIKISGDGAFLRSDSFVFRTGWLERYHSMPFPSYALDEKIGHWLVRQTNVPIPSAVWLFGSGLIVLVGLRKKLRRYILFDLAKL